MMDLRELVERWRGLAYARRDIRASVVCVYVVMRGSLRQIGSEGTVSLSSPENPRDWSRMLLFNAIRSRHVYVLTLNYLSLKMRFKNPFAHFSDDVQPQESFGDFTHLDGADPAFIHQDFDINSFSQRRKSDDTCVEERSTFVVPSIVTLARAYFWDRLPAGYRVYHESEGDVSPGDFDLETFANEKKTWRPLFFGQDPDTVSRLKRVDSWSSEISDAAELDPDDPRIHKKTEILDVTAPTKSDHRVHIETWKEQFKAQEGRDATAQELLEYYKANCA